MNRKRMDEVKARLALIDDDRFAEAFEGLEGCDSVTAVARDAGLSRQWLARIWSGKVAAKLAHKNALGMVIVRKAMEAA